MARSSIVAASMSSAASKVVVLGFSGALAFITTHVIVTRFGVPAYAEYGLLASMAALLPFADLGMSAAVLTVVSASDDPRQDPVVRRTITSVLRVLVVSAAVLVLVGALVWVTGAWPALLGEGLRPVTGSRAAMACVVVFALTLPLGVGQRIMIALGKNHRQVLLQGIAAPTILALVLLMLAAGPAAQRYVGVTPYVASSAVALASFVLAWRWLSPQLRSGLRDVPRTRAVPSVPVMNVAGPMLVQMVAVPLSLQSDRVLLSHLASTQELARYGLAAQLFGLVIQTVNTAGVSLWPVFARARARGEVLSPYRASVGFLAAALVAATGLALCLPWILPVIVGDRIQLDTGLVTVFVAYVGLQGLKYPLGMYMNDVAGLRFQVLPIIAMVPVNIALSWLLIPVLGAAGTVLASTATVLAFQVLPNTWYVHRDMARRREQSAQPAAVGA